jgi:hypothetical protein
MILKVTGVTMEKMLRGISLLTVVLALAGGCSTGGLISEKRDGNYLVIADIADVSIADVGYAGVAPDVRSVAGSEWGINDTVGKRVEQVIGGRVNGKAFYVDDREIIDHLSYKKILLMRKLDANDAEFIREKYAAQVPDYLVLVTKSRFGMSDFSGAGMRQKDIPMADFHCQFFAAMQLEVFELSTGKILSTLTESQREDCPVKTYFDDINRIDSGALDQIREGVVRVTNRTANKIARHLLMTDAEKDEFKLRAPGFE